MLAAIFGGVLIGGSAGLLMLARERIAGIGGMIAAVARGDGDDRVPRVLFLAGLVLAGLTAALVHPASLGAMHLSLPAVAVGGLLVGYGVERGSGCTSGHGVCGLSRFSKRSLVATLTFMATGALTVWVTR